MHEVALVPVGMFPIGRGMQELALQAYILAAFGQPFAQAFPLSDQGFVSDLNRGAASGVIAVKCEQAVAAEAVNDLFDDITVAQGQQLGLQICDAGYLPGPRPG